jgi:hypothetical protein
MTSTNMVVFLQNNEFMGFVEPVGADEIKASARKAGYEVADYGSYFNVEGVKA